MSTPKLEITDDAPARAAYFAYVSSRGFPNGLPTWDELPIAFPDTSGGQNPDGQHLWRDIANAVAAALPHIQAQIEAAPLYFSVDYTGCIYTFSDRETAIESARRFAETANGGKPTATRAAALQAQIESGRVGVKPYGAPLEFGYTNWRGEFAIRRAIPMAPHFGATEWHPEPQWLLTMWDVEKDAERDFAINDISRALGHTVAEHFKASVAGAKDALSALTLTDNVDAKRVPDWLKNCCECGRVVDTRERHEGGDHFGSELDNGRWTCSWDCWEKAADIDPTALTLTDNADADAKRVEELEQNFADALAVAEPWHNAYETANARAEAAVANLAKTAWALRDAEAALARHTGTEVEVDGEVVAPTPVAAERLKQLIGKLRSAKANGDPSTYLAFVTVDEAHEIADIIEGADTVEGLFGPPIGWVVGSNEKPAHLFCLTEEDAAHGAENIRRYVKEGVHTGVKYYPVYAVADIDKSALQRNPEGEVEIWVRPREEFEDGRFEDLRPNHDGVK